MKKGNHGHATRGGFRASRRMGAGTGGGMAGLADMPMAGGAPSTDGSDALAPGETSSMPAPMPGQMGGGADPGFGTAEPMDDAYGSQGTSAGAGAGSFRRGGRVR